MGTQTANTLALARGTIQSRQGALDQSESLLVQAPEQMAIRNERSDPPVSSHSSAHSHDLDADAVEFREPLGGRPPRSGRGLSDQKQHLEVLA